VNIKLKNTVAYLLYYIILRLVRLIPQKNNKNIQNHLLIIKTDEIGDYILFRNFLPFFKKSNRYSNFKVTFLGNSIYRQLFEEFDAPYVDNALWVDKKKFKSDLHYRFNTLKQLRSIGFTEVVNCIYSRGVTMDDSVVAAIGIENSIGFISDNSNRTQKEIALEKILYRLLIDSGNTNLFDLYRNADFLSKLLSNDQIKQASSLFISQRFMLSQRDNYYIVFSGAGKQNKKWKPNYFAEVIRYIYYKYGILPIICGSKSETDDSQAILRCIDDDIPINNLTGKTSLVETLELLNRAKFALSVDTGSVHLASSVKCPVIGLFSGKHYGRFAPYPAEIFNQFFVIYPDHIDELIRKKDQSLSDPNNFPNEAIQQILPEKVMVVVDKMLNHSV